MALFVKNIFHVLSCSNFPLFNFLTPQLLVSILLFPLISGQLKKAQIECISRKSPLSMKTLEFLFMRKNLDLIQMYSRVRVKPKVPKGSLTNFFQCFFQYFFFSIFCLLNFFNICALISQLKEGIPEQFIACKKKKSLLNIKTIKFY